MAFDNDAFDGAAFQTPERKPPGSTVAIRRRVPSKAVNQRGQGKTTT